MENKSNYKYTDTEIKSLLQSIVILIDTREQQNDHLIRYFESKKIPYKVQKLDYADYSCMLPKNNELGIIRDTYFTQSILIERKGCLEELSGNLTKDRSRLEEEFTMAKGKLILLIEGAAYEDIINHKYNTKYEPKAFIASIKSFEARYGINTNFITKAFSGNFIYYTLYYHIREILLN